MHAAVTTACKSGRPAMTPICPPVPLKEELATAKKQKEMLAERRTASGTIDLLKDVVPDFKVAFNANPNLDEYMHQSCELLLAKAINMMEKATSALTSADPVLNFTIKDVKNVQSDMVGKKRTSVQGMQQCASVAETQRVHLKVTTCKK